MFSTTRKKLKLTPGGLRRIIEVPAQPDANIEWK